MIDVLLAPPFLQINFLGDVSTLVSIFSSVAIILGAVFVVFQLKQDDKLLAASIRQANSSADQARFTMEQLKQNNELATMDLIMRIYEFADSAEVQSSWVAVLSSHLSSFEDFEKLPERKQLAFHQVASLFESIGLLVEKGFVKAEIVDDMFATKLAWDMTKPFITGMRKKYATEDYYFFFEKLFERLSNLQSVLTP